MKKPAKTAEECIDRLQAAADSLASEGADPSSIVAALVKVTITTAKKDRRVVTTLDAAARVLMDAAERTFQQAKHDRADKRGRSRKD